MVDARPTWQLVLQAASQLTRDAPNFRSADLIAAVRAIDPDRGITSIRPVIQGMTKNATGGPSSPCGTPFVRIERGLYAKSDNEGAARNGALPRMAPPMKTRRRVRLLSATELDARVSDLTRNFDDYVSCHDEQVPFRRKEQYELHRLTIDRRRELGSAFAAATDERFTDLLRQTLLAWGIGKRASRLVAPNEFRHRLAFFAPQLATLDHLRLEDPQLPLTQVSKAIDELITNLGVVDNAARIVAGTKTLHHFLPDLVPPMDRAWTGAFFGWNGLDPTLNQTAIFYEAFTVATRVATSKQPSRLIGDGWRTSVGKLFDNALIGYCKHVGIGG